MVTGDEVLLASIPDQGAEPQYHLSGGPGAAPAGMRIHHQQPPPQPSTPPTQHELAAMHQQPPQQGQGQVVFHMNRPVQPPPQPGYRQQPVQAARPPVRTNGSYPQGHQFIPGQQQVGMAFHNLSGIPQQASNLMVVPPGSFIPQGQGARGPFPLFGHGQYTMPHPGYLPYPYYRGNPVGSMPGIIQQPAAAAIPPVSAPSSQPKMRPNRLIITDPVDGHDVVETMFKEEITPSQSGESSARETPQLQNAVSQQQSQAVQQELAIKISNALASEGSSFGDDEQPQQPAVQVSAVPPPHPPNQEIPVETEDVIRPAMDPSGRIVMEHDLQFTGEPVQRWIQPMPMEHMQVPLGMVYGGQGMHHQPPVQQWPAEPIPNMAAQMAPPPPVHAPLPAKKPERATPVVSALAMGPHVDINHDYPALGGQRNTHQSPARSKRRPAPARIEPEPAEISVPAQLPPPVVQLPQQPPVVAAVVAPPPEEVKPPSPVPIAAAPQGPELVAPQEPPVVINDSSNSSSAVDAKVNHHKSKGNKRQHQQQHQQQVRQATPPPPRSATPVQTTLPEPAAAPAPAPAPVPAPVEIVKPEPPAPSIPPLPTPPVPVAPAVAEPPTPAVTPAVDEPVPKPAEIEKKMPESQSTEAIKVAAMNEENDKLTASTKVIEQKLNSTPAEPIKLENKLPLPMPVPNNNNNNNNISNVAPVVKVVVEDLTPTPTQTPPPSLDPAAVIENSKPVIRRIYRDDQWSPENRDGKRIYSREFLMGLQNDPQSQKKA